MKINFSFSKLLENDKLVRILAVVVAIIIWFIVAITVDPDGDTYISNIPVKFDLTNTVPEEYNLSVIEGMEQTVSVKIEGKRYKLGNLSSEDFVAIPNLNNVKKAGEYELTVDVKKVDERDEDYKVASTPATIKVRFDTITEKTFDLVAVAENITAIEGYIREELYSSPSTITLNGPTSEIEQIAKCVVYTEEEETSDETLTKSGELAFYDTNNNKLTLKYTKYEEEDYEIRIPIYKQKTVPIKVNFLNIPQGLNVDDLDITLSHDSINIAGPKSIVDEYDEIVLNTIDLRRADIGSTFQLDINLLAGIINVSDIKTVTVTINPEGLDTKQFAIPKTHIVMQNVPSSYDITLNTDTIYNVKIVGKVEDIEMLSANDLVAVVDFNHFELIEGGQRVAVSIYATGNKFVWAVGDYRVLINAEKK